MYNSFLLETILSIISFITSILLLTSGVILFTRKNNIKKPSCIYYLFFSIFYLIYTVFNYLNQFRFESNIMYLLPSIIDIVSIVYVMFLFLFEGSYIQENIEARKEIVDAKISIKRQRQLKISETITQLLVYVMLLQLLLIVSLNSVFQETKLLFTMLSIISFLLLFNYSIITTFILKNKKVIGYLLIVFSLVNLIQVVLSFILQDYTILFIIKNYISRNILRIFLTGLFIILDILKNLVLLKLIKIKLKGIV